MTEARKNDIIRMLNYKIGDKAIYVNLHEYPKFSIYDFNDKMITWTYDWTQEQQRVIYKYLKHNKESGEQI